ncbi:MAG: TetR/AcrR family transcriptional regulator [Bacteroidales bacterium]|nr:TetR/AcrR family transcriptional regulator [Bacteroidales bacterium]
MNTEEKIKAAAQKVFKQKGYAGTKTRDIAEEAGVNPALLNYYFRSKDALFGEVMKDVMRDFISAVRPALVGEGKDFREVLIELFNRLTDLYLEEPDLVIFVINELRTVPKKLFEDLRIEEVVQGTVVYDFFKRNFLDRGGRSSMEAGAMFLLNCVSFVLFPFVLKPGLENVLDMKSEEFREIIDERRKLYPAWRDFLLEQYHFEV